MKRKQELAEGSVKKRTNVSLSEKLLEDTKDKNRSEELEKAYWAMHKDIKENDDEK